MHPDLDRCWSGLQKELQGLSRADLEWQPATGWSIGMILEHLDLTYSRNAEAAVRRLAKGALPARRRTLRQTLSRIVVVVIGYFPAGIKAPGGVVPQGRASSDVVAGLERRLRELDAALSDAERAFGKRAILDHPIIGPFSAADWRRFHLVHTRHHLKQIQERRKLRASS